MSYWNYGTMWTGIIKREQKVICTVMHNKLIMGVMGAHQLETTEREKDLGKLEKY